MRLELIQAGKEGGISLHPADLLVRSHDDLGGVGKKDRLGSVVHEQPLGPRIRFKLGPAGALRVDQVRVEEGDVSVDVRQPFANLGAGEVEPVGPEPPGQQDGARVRQVQARVAGDRQIGGHEHDARAITELLGNAERGRARIQKHHVAIVNEACRGASDGAFGVEVRCHALGRVRDGRSTRWGHGAAADAREPSFLLECGKVGARRNLGHPELAADIVHEHGSGMLYALGDAGPPSLGPQPPHAHEVPSVSTFPPKRSPATIRRGCRLACRTARASWLPGSASVTMASKSSRSE